MDTKRATSLEAHISRQDYIQLTRDVEALLREYDSGSFELVLRATERFEDPARYLVALLGSIRRIYSERSGGMHGAILELQKLWMPNETPRRKITNRAAPIVG